MTCGLLELIRLHVPKIGGSIPVQDVGMCAEACGGMRTCAAWDRALVEAARAEEIASMQKLGIFVQPSCMANV